MHGTPFNNPKLIAEHGERLYKENFQEKFETDYLGKFVAIDVTTEKAYVGDSPEEAYRAARKDSPQGIFHLIRVGSPGAYKVSYTSNAALDWIFR